MTNPPTIRSRAATRLTSFALREPERFVSDRAGDAAAALGRIGAHTLDPLRAVAQHLDDPAQEIGDVDAGGAHHVGDVAQERRVAAELRRCRGDLGEQAATAGSAGDAGDLGERAAAAAGEQRHPPVVVEAAAGGNEGGESRVAIRNAEQARRQAREHAVAQERQWCDPAAARAAGRRRHRGHGGAKGGVERRHVRVDQVARERPPEHAAIAGVVRAGLVAENPAGDLAAAAPQFAAHHQ